MKTYRYDDIIINVGQINYIRVQKYNNSLEIYFSAEGHITLYFTSKEKFATALTHITNLMNET